MVLNVDEPFYVSPRNLSFGARDALHWERTVLPPSSAERLHRPAPPPGKALGIPDVCCHYALDGAEAARRRAAAESAHIPAPPPKPAAIPGSRTESGARRHDRTSMSSASGSSTGLGSRK